MIVGVIDTKLKWGNNVNFKKLFEAQAKLDKAIFEKAGIDYEKQKHEIAVKQTLALLVELSELANEIGVFKYWKHSHKIDSLKAREEWADVLHFFLSLGNYYGFEIEIKNDYKFLEIKEEKEVIAALGGLMYAAHAFDNQEAAMCFLEALLAIGNWLGMDQKAMVAEYRRKNRINYERITNGY